MEYCVHERFHPLKKKDTIGTGRVVCLFFAQKAKNRLGNAPGYHLWIVEESHLLQHVKKAATQPAKRMLFDPSVSSIWQAGDVVQPS